MAGGLDLMTDASNIAAQLEGATFDKTSILKASSRLGSDGEGEEAIFISFTLSDPLTDTWPTADVLTIRRRVIELAREEGLGLPVYVSLTTAHDEPQKDDEEESPKSTLF